MSEKTIVKLIKIYRWIEAYQQEFGVSPALREWAGVGISSTSVAAYYLRKLVELRMIQPPVKHRPRSLVLLPLEEADPQIEPYVEMKGMK